MDQIKAADDEIRMLEIMESSASEEVERLTKSVDTLSKRALVCEENVWCSS